MTAIEIRNQIQEIISRWSEIENVSADCVVLIVANQQQVATAASGSRTDLAEILCTAAGHEFAVQASQQQQALRSIRQAQIIPIHPEQPQ